MRIAAKKTLWWWLAACGFGGSAVFALLVISDGPPRGREVLLWAWPVVTTILAVIATGMLLRLYRQEPYAGPGLWQLDMLDLLAAAFYAGAGMAIWTARNKQEWLAAGIVATFLATLFFVLGLLTATRIGLATRLSRWLYSFCYVLRLYGGVGSSGVLVLLIVATLWGVSPIRLLEKILEGDSGSKEWPLNLMRWALFAVLPGVLGCHVALRMGLRKDTAAPIEAS